jgi:TPR repeat protein
MRLFSDVRKHLIPHRFGFVAAGSGYSTHQRAPGAVPASKAPYYVVGGIALSLALLAAAPHQATDKGNREQLMQQADAGDAQAQLQLGLAYRDGRYGLARDARSADGWLARAARSGSDYAAALLGDAYAKGDGVARDENTAERWWRQAALAGNAHAEAQLGQTRRDSGIEAPAQAPDRIDRTLGVTQGHSLLGGLYRLVLGDVSDSRSIDTLKHRALAGDGTAQYQLAMRYRDGAWGVEADPAQALVWLRQAARNGNPIAMTTLADAHAKGELGLAPDPARAQAWRQRAEAAEQK